MNDYRVKKPSEIDVQFMKEYLNIEVEFIEYDELIGSLIAMSIDYVSKYTQKSIEELDEFIYISLAILKIISDSYMNKGFVITKEHDKMLNSYLSLIGDFNL
ncbi:Uncharacterised protein [Clostridioides difficile]|uniref:head-tail connector protein n=1 Tax=Clostridioides difficile TaxID=1496 RepID=UPI000D1F2300|nr:head-tail connector protein [Clostridioides difficile]UWD40701.1 head-tail connector protein [Clostridioides difficile]UWD44487.1 head-tail connector protein [Clostridioides difficile]VFF94737.1 Uncharacterised protein [Clostridioides difficile]VIG11113.1 Uncharacterised protein [Clostridioides difficile]HBE9438113.1 phage gp6-like head-tail connector protein [Clostridioides difficile]